MKRTRRIHDSLLTNSQFEIRNSTESYPSALHAQTNSQFEIRNSKFHLLMTATVLWVVMALLVGCASNRTLPNAAATSRVTKFQKPPEYRMQPGDEMDIKFFFNPELNQTVFVRPDGKISLPVVDDVQAAGLTPSELDALITQIYARELRKPMVTVIVKTFTGRQVYVGGRGWKTGRRSTRNTHDCPPGRDQCRRLPGHSQTRGDARHQTRGGGRRAHSDSLGPGRVGQRRNHIRRHSASAI